MRCSGEFEQGECLTNHHQHQEELPHSSQLLVLQSNKLRSKVPLRSYLGKLEECG